MKNYTHIRIEFLQNTVVLWLDHQDRSVNVLTVELVDELTHAFRDFTSQRQITGVIIASAKPKQFIAGANIEEIFKLSSASDGAEKGRIGQELMHLIEQLHCPTLAIIDGPALGGGLELALACTYRICGDGEHVKLGLPETQLGILPGWGGTQRLPVLIGLMPAMDMILSGSKLSGSRAFKMGLSDDVAPTPILFSVAQKWISKGKTNPKRSKQPIWIDWALKIPFIRNLLYTFTRKKMLKQTKGFYPAPLGALEVIEKTYLKNNPLAYELEAQKLGELMSTPVCKSLVGIFLATEEAKRKKFGAPPKKIEHTSVIGAGVMGGGIAHLMVSQNKSARLKDLSEKAVFKGVQVVYDLLEKDRKKRKQTSRFTQERMNKLTQTTDNSGFEKTEFVIEAVVEDINVKKRVFHDLASLVLPQTILATNTSGLSISKIAEGIPNPERILGFHFFNPVAKMPLIEIVKGDKTSETALATAYKLALDLGKTPIVVKDSPGFLVNRILGLYMSEALRISCERASIQSIEHALKDFGMPMGPFELFDEVGLDVAFKVGQHLSQSFAHFPKDSGILSKMIADERLGKKSGAGFYDHSSKSKKLSTQYLGSLKLNVIEDKVRLPNEEALIAERLTYLMINEAARCLEEKVVEHPRDVDLGMILGTGFAPFRGGLLKYANSQGIRRVYDKLLEFSQRHGDHYKPTLYLHELAKADATF